MKIRNDPPYSIYVRLHALTCGSKLFLSQSVKDAPMVVGIFIHTPDCNLEVSVQVNFPSR
ncbi:MAG: hypothetical protein H6Q55_877, partial [Deltaproteobacteria bacterium]|nr:hypothetical protein [Deltaproteobacteria bacterium]